MYREVEAGFRLRYDCLRCVAASRAGEPVGRELAVVGVAVAQQPRPTSFSAHQLPTLIHVMIKAHPGN